MNSQKEEFLGPTMNRDRDGRLFIGEISRATRLNAYRRELAGEELPLSLDERARLRELMRETGK